MKADRAQGAAAPEALRADAGSVTASPSGLKLRKHLLALVLGAMLPLGFAPLGWSPIVLLALAAWFVLLPQAATRWQAACSGFAFGLGFFLVGASWVYVSLHVYGHMVMPLAALATFLFAAYLALFPALAAVLFRLRAEKAHDSAARSLLLWAPLLWTASEWLRGWLFTGFPWLALGYSQAPSGWLAGFTPLMGTYGVTWLLAIQAGLLAWVWQARRQRAAWLRPGAVFMALSVAGIGLAQIGWTQPVGEPVKVALLQGNISQDQKWLAEVRVATMRLYLDMLRATDARIVVMPETALPMFFDQVPREFLEEVEAHARQHRTVVLMGAVQRTAADGAFDYFNAVVPLGEGVPANSPTYTKAHLVPFGEYIPMGFGWILKVLQIPLTDFARGGIPQPPLQVAGQKVAANICYEDAFGDELRHGARNATLLVNVSNVAWFGRSWAADQHFQMSQMRAQETGRWMLRATNTGVTGAIDERGRAIAALPQHELGVLEVSAQGRTGDTPYLWWGDWPVLALLAALGIFAWRLKPAV